VSNWLLSVQSGPVARQIGLLLTDKSAVVGVRVPPLTLEMIDATRKMSQTTVSCGQ
jgi:hypothetical protein